MPGFTSTYQVHQLVFYEEHATIAEMVRRKLDLIEASNPSWADLSLTLSS